MPDTSTSQPRSVNLSGAYTDKRQAHKRKRIPTSNSRRYKRASSFFYRNKHWIFFVHVLGIFSVTALSFVYNKTGVQILFFPLAFSAWLHIENKTGQYTAVFTAFAGYLLYIILTGLNISPSGPGFNYELCQYLFNMVASVASLFLFSIAGLKIQQTRRRLQLKEEDIRRRAIRSKALKNVLQSTNRSLYDSNLKLNQLADENFRQLDIFLQAINFNIPLSITDAHGTILEVNDPFCLLTGYDRSDLVGNNHMLINSGYHDVLFFRDFWNTILSGKKWKGEIQNKTKEGIQYWIEIVVIGLLNPVGEIEKFISLQFPITEKKDAQAALELYVKSLEEMAFITSHKIRKPVTNIKGLIDLLEPGQLNDQDFPQIRQHLIASATQLDNFTIDLNNFICNQIKSKSRNS